MTQKCTGFASKIFGASTAFTFLTSLYASVCLGFLVQIPGSLVYYGNLTDPLKSSNLYSVQNAFYIPELSHLPISSWAGRDRSNSCQK
jgi:hypothetical protein